MRIRRPLAELRCANCGYGVRARRLPRICPMCGGESWQEPPPRTGNGLLDDLTTRRRKPDSAR
jgi:hypothetical protein